MPSPLRSSPFDLSLEALRRDHPQEYRRWVLVGLVLSLVGYGASLFVQVGERGWPGAMLMADPYVVLADLVALALLLRGRVRAAAYVAVAGPLLDVHVSLLLFRGTLLFTSGLVAPTFVLGCGFLFGGRAAFRAAGLLSLSIPAMLWLSEHMQLGVGPREPISVHFVVVLEGVLLATTGLLAAFLRSFSEILTRHQESEARSRELTTQLLHAQKLEALGLLAGGIAHDFNNLLMAIGGYGSLLDRSSDPQARRFGGEIVSAQKRGAALTRQLLAFARKDIAQPKPMDLARTLREMTTLIERAVSERVKLHVDCEQGCTIIADPGRIEQVVLNLAVNARDAMPDGGRLWIRGTASEREVRLEVEDEGVGMDDATKARVFEPFFTTKGRHHGSGLGLSTVHGIIADCSGVIEIDSELGRGTRFSVRWPRTALVPERASEAPIALSGAARTIWLVEDNDGARVYVERLLRERGFRVETAISAEQALELAAKASAAPDLLLCDVLLPGLTGPKLAEQLRARWPSLPCLFMSGYLGDVALGPSFDLAGDLVPKPFTSVELLDRIGKKLSRN